MKVVRRDLVPNGPGSVKMIPVDSDDLWSVYNLIATGDSVMARTVRKVLRETAGGRDAERITLKLEIKVEAIDYDKEGSILRIRGKNILENEHVKIGAFHTLELELHRPFVLRKDIWDSLALDVLQQASDPGASADLAVVLMQEGLANILLVGKSMTSTRSRIETSIPRKHGPAIAGYEAARACYGPKHVEIAHERMAVQTLLITDDLFRNSDIATRQKYVNLVNSVKDSGGTAHIFSSMHVSGEQLAQLTGIAAILRFPLPDLEDIEM
ncbi:Eukaryotic release factor 1 family protein isoform 4 [Theobroma cacao]|uniref:Eukaryotic release factor 1 family protein isoform 4 n=1 Tax=Theobroma cacao TaxID=3641 RepID=A0A061EXY9_THECC|nr:Eukaryotic release factor 1 family protein isoform 4 [Theobroma cacao]